MSQSFFVSCRASQLFGCIVDLLLDFILSFSQSLCHLLRYSELILIGHVLIELAEGLPNVSEFILCLFVESGCEFSSRVGFVQRGELLVSCLLLPFARSLFVLFGKFFGLACGLFGRSSILDLLLSFLNSLLDLILIGIWPVQLLFELSFAILSGALLISGIICPAIRLVLCGRPLLSF